MCRAVWVAIVGATDEACKLLRRAAGPDAQVVALITDPDEARALAGPVDLVVVDGEVPGSRALVADLRAQRPDAALVWVGHGAPEQVHASAVLKEGNDDILSGAITKALIARGTSGRTM